MVLNNYLEKLSHQLVISYEEKMKIEKSLKELQSKLVGNLKGVSEQFCFGSYLRKTKLPMVIDPNTDIDYLIVFSQKPRAFLRDLSKFVEKTFDAKDIIQLTPTCKIRVNDVVFELIPAFREGNYFINYKIPTEDNGKIEWLETVPNDNDVLEKLSSEHQPFIRPVIRLLKYWNVLNKSVYSAYLLEMYIISLDFPRFDNLADYFFYTVDQLSTDTIEEESIEVVETFKKKIKAIELGDNEDDSLLILSSILPYL